MRFALTGSNGRMGQAILRLARGAGDICVLAQTREVSLVTLGEASAEVLIDFSSPENFLVALASCVAAKVPFVSGTTGLKEVHFAALEAAATAIPVLWAPNTSLGVAVLSRLVAEASRALGEAFDVEIVEAHHRKKVDAPSGTALRLAAAVQTSDPHANSDLVFGRSGTAPARGREVAVLAMRGGDVIGDHHVHFLGDGERLELVHRATNRDLFARGALRAAHFVRGKAPCRYSFDDALGF